MAEVKVSDSDKDPPRLTVVLVSSFGRLSVIQAVFRFHPEVPSTPSFGYKL